MGWIFAAGCGTLSRGEGLGVTVVGRGRVYAQGHGALWMRVEIARQSQDA
jgi:hypothetical protein